MDLQHLNSSLTVTSSVLWLINFYILFGHTEQILYTYFDYKTWPTEGRLSSKLRVQHLRHSFNRQAKHTVSHLCVCVGVWLTPITPSKTHKFHRNISISPEWLPMCFFLDKNMVSHSCSSSLWRVTVDGWTHFFYHKDKGCCFCELTCAQTDGDSLQKPDYKFSKCFRSRYCAGFCGTLMT